MKSSTESFRHFASLMPEIINPSDLKAQVMVVFFTRLHTRERVLLNGKRIAGVKNSTVKTYASRLKSFFKWMKSRAYIANNPLDDMKFPAPVYDDNRALKGEEIKRIMGALVQNAQSSLILQRDLSMVAVLTFCGVRRTELSLMEVRDLDFTSDLVTIRSETSKSKVTRRIPMHPTLKFHLQQYLKERKGHPNKTHLLFLSSRGDAGLTLAGLKHWVERLSRSSGVKFHLHRFRHTFATNLALQDVGMSKIQRLMGHKDIKMTQAYLRSIDTEKMGEDIKRLTFETLA
ncbi:MAG: site-specific integrase [Bacteroidetes bacterium]|nr:site-specific integrase [Bacteroidota bacterium]